MGGSRSCLDYFYSRLLINKIISLSNGAFWVTTSYASLKTAQVIWRRESKLSLRLQPQRDVIQPWCDDTLFESCHWNINTFWGRLSSSGACCRRIWLRPTWVSFVSPDTMIVSMPFISTPGWPSFPRVWTYRCRLYRVRWSIRSSWSSSLLQTSDICEDSSSTDWGSLST